jgi:APA family basic amino acid/polyamine antiporter
VLVIVAVAGVNIAGVRWTARGAWAYVGGVLVVLVVVVVTGLTSAGGEPPGSSGAATLPMGFPPEPGGLPGVLTAAGLVFFAYAGFARIPTLGDAVRDPRRTLPRAAVTAVGFAAAVYLLVAVALLLGLGARWLAAEPAPLVAVVDEGGAAALGVLVRVGAAVASGSALLSVLAGVSRTAATMARRGELPRSMGAAGPWGTPWRADVAGALAAVLVALLAGPTAAIALAACALLVHYAVLGLTALRLPAAGRAWPAWTSALGTVLCLLLAAVLPLREVLTTAAVLTVGWAVCTLLARRAPAG